jgi:peptidoglycan/LPS O-acetylase OafA/YrhL
MKPSVLKYYPFLEGVRGLTALYVVIHHIWLRLVTTDKLDDLPVAFHLFKFGHAAVAIFIVLSGFCLMLPVAQQAEWTLPPQFFLRRARRILPAYGATLLLSLLLGAASPALLPAHSWSGQSLVSHLFLVQNWTAWPLTINGPLWSVALECQIYVLFALVLLPVCRRYGLLATVGVAALLSAVALALRLRGIGAWPYFASPWFLVLFVFGMGGAIAATRITVLSTWQRQGVWVLLVASLVAHLVFWPKTFPWPSGATFLRIAGLDLLLGSAVVAFIIAGAADAPAPRPRSVFWLLSRPPLLKLGSLSSSLYLLHDPLLTIGFRLIPVQAVPSTSAAIFLLCLLLLPLIVSVGWLFHQVFERPFLSPRARG